uniref:Venom protein n=1 Tax=Hadrurus spadix TaxID=141984 RepID=A0A1W7R941_9SCOR
MAWTIIFLLCFGLLKITIASPMDDQLSNSNFDLYLMKRALQDEIQSTDKKNQDSTFIRFGKRSDSDRITIFKKYPRTIKNSPSLPTATMLDIACMGNNAKNLLELLYGICYHFNQQDLSRQKRTKYDGTFIRFG